MKRHHTVGTCLTSVAFLGQAVSPAKPRRQDDSETAIALLTTSARLRHHTLTVTTGSGALAGLHQVLQAHDVDRAAVIYDPLLPAAHLRLVGAALGSIPTTWAPVSSGGDNAKTLAEVATLLSAIEVQVTRDSAIISVGGGSVTNVAGTCAALLFRGVRLIHVPTTVMAQCDGAIGLKQAVNSNRGKNMYGAYHAPLAVLNDVRFLSTMPEALTREGCAEIAKAALACGGGLLEWLLRQSRSEVGYWHDRELLTYAVHAAAELKIKSLAEDPTEEGSLKLMEIGHLTAHAIETATAGLVRHGQGVAMGVGIEARYARAAKLPVQTTVFPTIARLFDKNLGLPTRLPASVDVRAVIQAIETSNKRRTAGAEIVLPLGRGRSLAATVDLRLMEEVLAAESRGYGE